MTEQAQTPPAAGDRAAQAPAPEGRVPRAPDRWAVLALLGVSLLLWAPRLRGPIDLRWDAGVYYILGTSLAEGKGYRILSEPGEIQAVQYPPLLPALVALHQKALGTSDPAVVGQWLRWTYCLLFTGYLVAVYALARLFLGPPFGFCVGLLTGLYLFSYYLSDLLFAEVPFALAAVLFVLAYRRGPGAVPFGLTALAGVAAFLLRTAGLALLAAWFADALLRRQWKAAVARAAVALVPVAAWQGYVAAVTHGEEYRHPAYAYQRAPYQYYNVSYAENLLLVDSFRPEKGHMTATDLAARVAGNLLLMPASLGEGVSTKEGYWRLLFDRVEGWLGTDVWLPPWLTRIPVQILGCVVLAGLVVLAVRGEWLIPLFTLGSVALVCLTPWPEQFPRYMAPLTPFLALALLTALVAGRDLARRRLAGVWRKAGTVGLALTMAAALTGEAYSAQYEFRRLTQNRRGMFFYDKTWMNYDAALAWLRDKVGPGDVVATWVPHWAYLWGGHRAVMPPMDPDLQRSQQLLEAVPVRFLIIDELDFLDLGKVYTEPVLKKYPERWELVFATPNRKTRVYRLKG